MSNKTTPNTTEKGFVSIEDFIRTRDSVVTGLSKLNGAINTLINAYVTHTNALLNSNGQTQAALDTKELSDYLSNAGLSGNVAGAATTKDSKKKVKKERDPNAPKRPLTAFFLFSVRARDMIKKDLGNPTPSEINAELLRRWNEMTTDSKNKWKEMYNVNYEQYKKDVEKYQKETGQAIAPEAVVPDDDDDIVPPTTLGASAAAEDSDPDSSSSSDSSSDDEPEPVKEPSPPPTTKKAARPRAKKAAAAPAPPPVSSPSPSAQLQAPTASAAKGKKRGKDESPEQPKKKAKKAEAAPPAPSPVETKKKAPKKSRKNDS